MSAESAVRRKIEFQVPKRGHPSVTMTGGCGHWLIGRVDGSACEIEHSGDFGSECAPPLVTVDFAA